MCERSMLPQTPLMNYRAQINNHTSAMLAPEALPAAASASEKAGLRVGSAAALPGKSTLRTACFTRPPAA